MDYLTEDQRRLLDVVPEDGTIGNKYLRQILGWPQSKYWKVRNSLIPHYLATGRGRGGSVRRVYGDAELLVNALDPNGAATTNPAHRRRLGWDDDRYWAAQMKARNQGLIEVGRGRGGTLWRAPSDDETAEEVIPEPEVFSREMETYAPIKTVLVEDWAPSQNIGQLVCEVTALQGKRKTGGVWSRPDLTLVACRTFSLLPGAFFDVYTFEMKIDGAWDIMGIHEAVAHGRFSTRPYALFEVQDDAALESELFQAAESEARRLGVGLITARHIPSFDTWITHCDPERREPAPEALQDFMQRQLSQESQDEIRGWYRDLNGR